MNRGHDLEHPWVMLHHRVVIDTIFLSGTVAMIFGVHIQY